ncbi:MAG: hypothetical protein RL846_28920, partial [Deltaproteobacteria bacterium]
MNLRTLGTTVVGICLFSPLAFGSEAARVFEENVGQADARVTHFARGARDTFFVTRDGFAIVAPGYAVTAQLGRPGPVLERSALPGRVHHLVGDPKKWRADIDTFDVVTRVAGKGVTVD